nr:hypothetical protein [Paenibacillus roseus]
MLLGEIADLNRHARWTNEPIGSQCGNDMKSFAIAGINDFFAGVPAIHQDVDVLIIVCGKCFNHFHSQIIFALEIDSLCLTIFALIVRTKIEGVRLARTDDMRRNEIMTPYRAAFFVRILKAECFHLFGRLVFLTTSVVHDQEYESSGIATFQLLSANSRHDCRHTPPLHTTHAPGRVIQKVRYVTQMTIPTGCISNLRHILTSSTQNDAMDEGKQMTELWLRKFQLQRQNKLDDRQVEGYHEIGTSPFLGNCGLVNDNFSIQGRCPSSVYSFDEASQLLVFSDLTRRRYFRNTQANDIEHKGSSILVPSLRENISSINIRQ